MTDAALEHVVSPPASERYARVFGGHPGHVYIAAGFLVVVAIATIGGEAITPYDSRAQDLLASAEGPSAAHLLGTDDTGRDILSRVIAGSRTTVLGASAASVAAILIALLVAVWVGFRGGFQDSLVMRGVDLMYALPSLLVAIVVVGVLGGTFPVAVATIALFAIPYEVRVFRSAVREQRTRPYVQAATLLGLSSTRIAFGHIMPNIAALIVADLLLLFAGSLLALATLSFLGLGTPATEPEWGRMVDEARILLQSNPFAAIAPALAVTLTAVAATLVGEAMFERREDRGRMR